jgi:hypothetical protein
VYLDTSDYSRFGDLLRGKADPGDEQLYETLLRLKEAGEAIFPCSAPVLGELLQYDTDHRETSVCKARAVEALAGEDAFIFPNRLIMLEVAETAHNVGLLAQAPRAKAITGQRYWHPNVGNAFENLKSEIQSTIANTVAESGHNRAIRRAAKSKSRKFSMTDLAEAADRVVPQFANKWGLSEEGVRASIVAAIAGRLKPEEASRALFSEVAQPTTFIGVYFERFEGEKDLPFWMRDFGAQIQTHALKLRAALGDLPGGLRPQLQQLFREKLGNVGATLIKALNSDDLEFGVTSELVARFTEDTEQSARVPCSATMSQMMIRFALESADATAPEPQRSTGGDFIHALYARHSDLWRGDRRFSHFLKAAVPEVADRVVPRLSELPDRIQRFNAAR